MPIFSVVMPVYNVEKYVKQAVQSVLEQTFLDFEIIIIDDGATDNSLATVKQFNDSRIKIISQNNRGLAAARNTGVRASSGKYIAFLDSDDLWSPLKLQLHYEHLENNKEVGVSYSPSVLIDGEGNSLGIIQHPKLKNISFKDIICRNPIGNGSAPVLRREVLETTAYSKYRNGEKEKCYFDESFRQSEDIEYWLRIASSSSYKFEGIQDELTFYRINMSGLSANLEQQLISWEKAISKTALSSPKIIARWRERARAYQLRYLARRAIKSGNSKTAITMLIKSFATDKGVVSEEPVKSTVTFISALMLYLLPKSTFSLIERIFCYSIRAVKGEYEVLLKYKVVN